MTQRLNTTTRALIAGVVALICFVAVFFLVRGLLTAARERAFDALATRVVRGMSRPEAFTIVQSAGFVAFNGDAPDHRYEFVEVNLNSPQPFCSHLRSLKIVFDQADRVATVSNLPTKTVCSAL